MCAWARMVTSICSLTNRMACWRGLNPSVNRARGKKVTLTLFTNQERNDGVLQDFRNGGEAFQSWYRGWETRRGRADQSGHHDLSGRGRTSPPFPPERGAIHARPRRQDANGGR